MPRKLELRPATEADRDFVYEVRKQAFRSYVDLTFGGWDDFAQREEFATSFIAERIQIIESSGFAIGYLELVPDQSRTRIKTIAILEEERGNGVGSAVVSRVLASHPRVVLRVLKSNTGALRLYERLGFAVVGESEEHWWEMHYRGGAPTPPAE